MPALRTTICWVFLGALVALSGASAAPPRLAARIFVVAPVWTAALAAGPSAPISADAVRVYVPLASGQVVAHAAADGAAAWTQALATDQPVAVGEGLLFVAAGDAIHALAAETGDVRWHVPAGRATAPPVAAGGWVIVAVETGDLVAFRAIDGRFVWRQAIGPVAGAPAIDGDRLLVASGDRVIALALETGVPIWERTLGGAAGALLPAGNRVFVGSADNFFYSLSRAHGRPEWRVRTGADVATAAIVDEERVYFAALDNALRALDRSNGAQRWLQPLAARAPFGVRPFGDLVLVCGFREVRAFLRPTGAPAGALTSEVDLSVPPLVAGGAPGGLRLITASAAPSTGAVLKAYAPAPPLDLPLIPLPGVPWLRLPPALMPPAPPPAPTPGASLPR